MINKIYLLSLLAYFALFSNSVYCQSFSITTISPMCLDDGEAEVILNGIPEPVSVLWENNSLNEMHSGLNPTDLKNGIYTVTVTDANGDVYLQNYNMYTEIYWNNSNYATAECPNGMASIELNTYSQNYPVSIFFNGQLDGTSEDLVYVSTELPIGVYDIHITDDNGCRSSYTPLNNPDSNLVEIYGISDLEAEILETHDFCAGLYEVSYNITTETTGPYTHNWQYWANGELNTDYSETLSDIPNQTSVNLTITDADGCEKTFYQYLYTPSSIQATSSVDPANCPLADGIINMSVYGGTAPYEFLWSNGATTEDISGLSPGVYILEVTDADGCQNTFTKYVYESSDITITGSVTPPNCEENIDGQIDITISNTVGEYEIEWSTGETTEDISFTNFGYYYVTVTDSQGCSIGKSFWIPVSAPCYAYASGTVYYDLNGNCEVDAEDFPFNSNVFSSTGFAQNTSYNSSNYNIRFLEDVALSSALNGYTLNCPTEDVELSYVANQTYTGNDFFLQPDELEDDLRVYGYAWNPVPGFTTNGNITIQNLGTTIQDGTVTLEFTPTIQFQYSYPAPLSVDNELGLITWEIEGLIPGAYRNIQVNYYTDTSVELGEEIDYLMTVDGDFSDINPENNVYSFTREVIGSYDPNDKQVFPSGEGDTHMIDPSTEKLDYTVRFQNTGSAPAVNVFIEDELDITTLNASDIQITGSSHELTEFTIDDGKAFFVFENIYLPDSTSNLEGSQGYVSFQIGVNADLPLGTVIENDAAIFFDFNDPIITNNAFVTLDIAENVNELVKDNSLKIFPNPSTGNIVLSSELNLDVIEVLDLSGRVIWRMNDVGVATQIQITLPESVNNGVYVVRTTSGNISSQTQLVLMK